jgi:hypothetical protein
MFQFLAVLLRHDRMAATPSLFALLGLFIMSASFRKIENTCGWILGKQYHVFPVGPFGRNGTN